MADVEDGASAQQSGDYSVGDIDETSGGNMESSPDRMTNGDGPQKNGGDKEDAWPDEEPKQKQLDEFEKMEQEVIAEMEVDKEKVDAKKKKRRDPGDKKGRKKKKKGAEEGKENKKATYQNDILAKHVGPRIRSFDAAKMKSKFQKPKEATTIPPECRICNKIVFAMEKVVAEKANWHKNCFRCVECSKALTLETYQSNDGSLYCKPHFKTLFKPKAVVQDEAEERKERQMRRPRMIILESTPEILSDDVVRATNKPDYGLEELQTLNVKQRFAQFEMLNNAEEQKGPPGEPVKRSRSLMSKAARFLEGQEDRPYGVDNGELGEDDNEEYDEDEEEEEESEEEEGEDGIRIVKSKKKKERPMSFSGMNDLKSAWEQKQRREDMSKARKEEVSKFRMMLCAGKNLNLTNKFESGHFENEDEDGGKKPEKDNVFFESRNKASSLRARFEQGEPFIMEEEGDSSEEGEEGTNRVRRTHSRIIGTEQQEVEEVFKEAETAKRARNVFKNIDSKVAMEDGSNPVMRSSSFAANPAHRLSTDGMSSDGNESDVFGRDPNLIRCSDKYEDDVDCRNTKNLLSMFKKMEKGEEDKEEGGPPPPKRFTPPPEDNCDYESSEEYTGSYDDYTSDEDEEDEEYFDDEGQENGEERPQKAKLKDELLEMSAKKADQLRAKFEKWELNQKDGGGETKGGGEFDEEECRPSIDTARNLKAMFENKAAEDAKVHTSKQSTKVKRFV